MTDAYLSRPRSGRSTIGAVAIIIPSVLACILFALSAAIASSVEGKFDGMSAGLGADDPLGQADLYFSIGLGLLLASVPGIALVTFARTTKRAAFALWTLAAIAAISFGTYFTTWMLARPDL